MTADQAQAIQIAHAFLRAFDQCSSLISPPGSDTPDIFSSQRDRLKDHINRFGPEIAGEEFAAWNLEWQQETYDACTAIGGWLDGHPGNVPAEESFQALLPLAGLAQIRPALNTSLSLTDHNLVGTMTVTGASQQPGQVAGVPRRGYRRGTQVLRKADVRIFNQPILAPPPPPSSSNSAWLTLLLAAVVAVLAFLLWKDTRKPAAPVASVAINPAGPGDAGQANALRGRVAVTLFTVQPEQVKFGQPVTVNWEVKNASTVRITPWPGSVGSWGRTKFLPTEDTVAIVLEAKGEGTGNAVREERPIRVVRGKSPPAIVFKADRAQVPVGESVTLRWSVPDATSVRIAPEIPGFDHTRTSGEIKVSPETNTQYALTATGLSGAATKRVTVRVVPRIAVFEAVPNALDRCKVAVLRWTIIGATGISIEPGIGPVHSPYRVVRPQRTTRYTLKAEGPGGSSTRDVTVSVTPGPGPACGPI
jgi:hypothetical protein